jgi:hypothetical protein
MFFFRITQYIRDTHNAHTHPYEYTHGHTQTLPLGASSKTAPAIPQYWRSHHSTGASLSTGTSPTTESTNAVKFWEICSHGESNTGPEVLPEFWVLVTTRHRPFRDFYVFFKDVADLISWIWKSFENPYTLRQNYQHLAKFYQYMTARAHTTVGRSSTLCS